MLRRMFISYRRQWRRFELKYRSWFTGRRSYTHLHFASMEMARASSPKNKWMIVRRLSARTNISKRPMATIIAPPTMRMSRPKKNADLPRPQPFWNAAYILPLRLLSTMQITPQTTNKAPRNMSDLNCIDNSSIALGRLVRRGRTSLLYHMICFGA